jgi:acyl carrier protein
MFEQKIEEIICENIDIKIPFQDIEPNLKLAYLGVNSLIFIKIIVSIEKQFNINFEDEDLDYTKFTNIESLVSYVQNKAAKIS